MSKRVQTVSTKYQHSHRMQSCGWWPPRCLTPSAAARVPHAGKQSKTAGVRGVALLFVALLIVHAQHILQQLITADL